QRRALVGLPHSVLGPFPGADVYDANAALHTDGDGFRFAPEPGIEIRGRITGPAPARRLAVFLHPDGEGREVGGGHFLPLVAALEKEGWSVATFDLRATGKLQPHPDKVGR